MPKGRILAAALALVSGVPALAQSTIPASSADTILEGTQSMATFGTSLGPAGDVDGDGYDDVLIGDAGYDGALADCGRITLHRGSAGGLSPAPFWSLEGSAPFAFLSTAFAAGDVNGDGFDDVIVDDTAGHVLRLFVGSTSGLLPTSWTSAGSSGGGADTDGDGYSDVAVLDGPFTKIRILIFLGSAAGLEPLPATSVQPDSNELEPGIVRDAVLQDLDADGHADLAFTWNECVKHCIALAGRASVHMGSDAGLDTRARRVVDFGGEERVPSVAAARDLDGDGFRDLAFTLFDDPASGGADLEDVLVFRGSRNGIRMQPDRVVEVPFGTLASGGVQGAGDLNGDGFADLLVPVRPEFQPIDPVLLILRGGAGGLSKTPSTTIVPEQLHDGFPASASGAGDVNGDGLDDLIVSAPLFGAGGPAVGRVYVFHGKPSL